VRQAWTQCLDAIAEIAPDGDPHPDTARLYRELTGGPRRPQPAGDRGDSARRRSPSRHRPPVPGADRRPPAAPARRAELTLMPGHRGQRGCCASQANKARAAASALGWAARR
jgi:hypothetical protein